MHYCQGWVVSINLEWANYCPLAQYLQIGKSSRFPKLFLSYLSISSNNVVLFNVICYDGEELPEELNSSLYQLAFGKGGFVISHFCHSTKNLLKTL